MGEINIECKIFWEKTLEKIWIISTTSSEARFIIETENWEVVKEIEENGRIEGNKFVIWIICTGIFKLICVWNKART